MHAASECLSGVLNRHFRQCAEIVNNAARHDQIIVVVSAVGGVTDLILKTIDAARHGDPATTEAGLEKFEKVHEALIADLFAQHLYDRRQRLDEA